MDANEFLALTKKHLLPMLQGCEASVQDKKKSTKNIVSGCDGITGLKLYPAYLDKCIKIKRSQGFNNVEKTISKNFILFMEDVNDVFGKDYQANVEDYVMSKVIAASCDVNDLLGTERSSIYPETLQFITTGVSP